MSYPVPRGLYAVTDAELIADPALWTAVEQAILGGARMVQYRDKTNDPPKRLRQAQRLQELCQHYQVPLIINDDVELAAQVHTAGVHLGKDDLPLELARRRLGQTAIIGVSCYNQLSLALTATRQGADYVAFGSFFPSPTKPNAVQATLELLRQARSTLTLPIIAIGGITPSNGKALVAAGADGLAVIHGLFGSTDIQAAARAYAELYPAEPGQSPILARPL